MLLADVEELTADLGPGLVPRDLLPLPVHDLHRMAEPLFADHLRPRRGPLGAETSQIDRVLEPRLLAHPDPVLYLGDKAAPDRAVIADRFDLLILRWLGRRRRLMEDGVRQERPCHADSAPNPRRLQERTAVHPGGPPLGQR